MGSDRLLFVFLDCCCLFAPTLSVQTCCERHYAIRAAMNRRVPHCNPGIEGYPQQAEGRLTQQSLTGAAIRKPMNAFRSFRIPCGALE